MLILFGNSSIYFFNVRNLCLLNYLGPNGAIHSIILPHQKFIYFHFLTIFCNDSGICTLSATITSRNLLVILKFVQNFL